MYAIPWLGAAQHVTVVAIDEAEAAQDSGKRLNS